MKIRIIIVGIIILIGISLLIGITFESNTLNSSDTNSVVSESDIIDFTRSNSLYRLFSYPENMMPDGNTIRLEIEKKPSLEELYRELSYTGSDTIVIFPSFTLSAYTSGGFYDYYSGKCNESCLETQIRYDFEGGHNTSNLGFQILTSLGYDFITDIDVDKNPDILLEYETIILLHNEYVTLNEFTALTSHPNVVYLYPNALYAEIISDYETNTITLVRGHNYPDQEITNGFNWKYDNTHPFEYDVECLDWKFYQIENGIMLNCYPETIFHEDAFFLKAIQESEDQFWWTVTEYYGSAKPISTSDYEKMTPILEILENLN